MITYQKIKIKIKDMLSNLLETKDTAFDQMTLVLPNHHYWKLPIGFQLFLNELLSKVCWFESEAEPDVEMDDFNDYRQFEPPTAAAQPLPNEPLSDVLYFFFILILF